MENQQVWDIVLRWLFMCYDPPYVAPPAVEGAEFDPADYGREQYHQLLQALHPVRRPPPPPPRPPLIWNWPGTSGLTEADLEASLE